MHPVTVLSYTGEMRRAPLAHQVYEHLVTDVRAPLTAPGPHVPTLLLESAEPSSRHTQRSLLVTDAHLRIVCRGLSVTITALSDDGRGCLPFLAVHLIDRGFTLTWTDSQLTVTVRPLDLNAGDAYRHPCSTLGVLRVIHRALRSDDAHGVMLTGVFAYDLVDSYEHLPLPQGENPAADPVADYDVVLAAEVIAIDHLAGTTTITRTALPTMPVAADYLDKTPYPELAEITMPSRERRTELVRRVGEVMGLIQELAPSEGPTPARASGSWAYQADAPVASGGMASGPVVSVPEGHIDATPNLTDNAFAQLVTQLKDNITAGDVFQIVPSRTFQMPCPDALQAYLELAALNPSPYLFYAAFPEFTLFGASPESAVTVDGPSRRVEISPIAGTRRRGLFANGEPNADLDSRIEAELRRDAKETAEHMMLVDLARNDVARVSEPGSRTVTDLLRVDRYSHVMHLVSRVTGRLAEGLDALHAYGAAMNMGTLTGAPKVRAMQLLREVEPGRRGAYGGAIGYLDAQGTMDTAIAIRSATVVDGVAYIRAGAGVVADSSPDAEADETRRKAQAVLRAVHLASAEPTQPRASTLAPVTPAPAAPDTQRRVLLIDNVDSFAYNLVDALATLRTPAGDTFHVEVLRNTVPLAEVLASADRADLVVISPGPGAPEDAGCSLDIIRHCAGHTPILGVCLGHQAIVTAFGGVVGRAGEIVHGRTSPVTHTGHPMFGSLPEAFDVARYHSLVAHEVPSELEVTATTPGPAGKDLVMAVAHRDLPVYGLQFHPESVLTTEGQTLLSTLAGLALTSGASHA